jgi:hypothetical protein
MNETAATAAGALEQRIAARLAASGCRLRHDRVAVRLVAGVAAAVAPAVAPDRGIIFAVTAPIRQPARMIAALAPLLRDLSAGSLRTMLHGNAVHARSVARRTPGMPGVLGFVHNPDRDGGVVLDMVEAAIGER